MRSITLIPVALTVLSVGCSKSTDAPSVTVTSEGQKVESPAGKDAARENQGLVRFLNADPSGKAREILIDNSALFREVAYKGITEYMEVPRQAVKVRLREPGGLEDLADTNLEVLPGRHYTLVAVPGKKGASLLYNVADDLDNPETGHVKVRLINATSVNDLNLYRDGTKTKVQKNVDAGYSSRISEAPAGDFDIRADRRPQAPMLSNIHLEPDRVYTLVIVGDPSQLDVVRVEDRLKNAVAQR
jgi:hypothetical protein